MKPIKTIEEFKAILDRAEKEHKKLGLENVSLEILEKHTKQLQTTMTGDLTWHGTCARNCWFAKKKICKCRCEGAGHGRGLKKKEKQNQEG